MLDRIISEPTPKPSHLNAQVPPEIDLILARAMAKNPHDRYQDASEMAAALRRYKATA
jgi:serine/threonine protein kinase